jgi:hypothetical protein
MAVIPKHPIRWGLGRAKTLQQHGRTAEENLEHIGEEYEPATRLDAFLGAWTKYYAAMFVTVYLTNHATGNRQRNAEKLLHELVVDLDHVGSLIGKECGVEFRMVAPNPEERAPDDAFPSKQIVASLVNRAAKELVAQQARPGSFDGPALGALLGGLGSVDIAMRAAGERDDHEQYGTLAGLYGDLLDLIRERCKGGTARAPNPRRAKKRGKKKPPNALARLMRGT